MAHNPDFRFSLLDAPQWIRLLGRPRCGGGRIAIWEYSSLNTVQVEKQKRRCTMKKWVISCIAMGLVTWTGYVALAQPAKPAKPANPPRRRRPAPAGEVKTEIKAKDASEKKILDVLADMDKNQRRGMMNVPVQDGRLLRMLAETSGAKKVVEIGTSNGYSGIWICLALRKTGGKLITHEIDEGRAKLARENFKRAGVEKMITLVFGDAHKEVAKIKEPIDMIFLDADKAGYVDYMKQLLPKVRPGGLIIGHNVRSQASSMKPFLDVINTDKNLETLYLHMYGTGVSVSMKKR
jgi:caffeoyl-CoA O-methyltransferase